MAATAGPITEIVVAGGGITAWSAAAALKRRLPHVQTTIVPLPVQPEALADRMAPTLPSIAGFHGDIGISEGDAILRAGSSFRLGTRFEGWAEGRPAYVHAYGPYGLPFGSASFHQHWVRLAHLGKIAPFDSHSAAATIARAGRFAQPHGLSGSPLGDFEYGLQLDPPRYAAMMQAYARHVGVVAREGGLVGPRLNGESGMIEALRLGDGSEITGHLFVDCTGPAALLRSALDERFEDWGQFLPCDRILFAQAAPVGDLPALDKAVVTRAGWRWEAAGRSRVSHGHVYASARLGESEAEEALRAVGAGEPEQAAIPIRQGRRSQPWLRNCVAIGDAAVAVEPLEWTNLHLAHSQIDRIVSMIPDRDCSAVELWDYNRQCAAEADRVRDFVALHYFAADRPELPFWRDAAWAEPPASLAHSLSLFRERGRLPFYEEETFTRDSWLAVLIGQGVIPRRTDPLIDSVSPALVEQAMSQMRETIAAIVPSLPTQSDFLRHLTRQSTP
jgi:tryptophan halogenase